MLTLGELQLFLPQDIYLIEEPAAILLQEKEGEVAGQDEEPEETIVVPEPPTAPKPQRVLRPVLFVLDKPAQGLAEEMFKNLVNKALNLDSKDYSVLLQEEVDFSSLDQVPSTKVILFGVPFTGFETKYKNHSTAAKLVLFTDPLERIAETVELKRQLWAALQDMFPKK